VIRRAFNRRFALTELDQNGQPIPLLSKNHPELNPEIGLAI
jgi:hypothetical protein